MPVIGYDRRYTVQEYLHESVQNYLHETVQNYLVTPQSDWTEDTWDHDVALATMRQAIRGSKPKTQARTRNSHAPRTTVHMPKPKRERDSRSNFEQAIYGVLTTLLPRTLNDLRKTDQITVAPSHDQLASLAYVWTDQQFHDNFSSGFISHEWLDRASDKVAAFVLETWNPEWIKERQRSGSMGGSEGRRTAKWTVEMLEGIEPLNWREVAAELKCSRSKAFDLIKEWNARPQEELRRGLDALLVGEDL